MTAFQHADSVGTDMLELDCQLTKDGIVVVSHDDELHRVAGHHITVSETLYKELPHLKSQLKPDFYWGKVTVTGTDRRIPTLEEVMESFPNMPLNIDIKTDNDQLISKVADLIRKYQREDRTVWGNRSSVVVNKLRKEHPNVPVFFSAQRILQVVALFYVGFLPFIPIHETHFEMIMPSIVSREGMFAFRPNWKWKLMARLIDFFVMNKFLIWHLQARGIEVYLWVLNEEEDWHRAFAYGVNGVMTDCPTKLSQFLNLNPQYQRSS